MLFDQSESSRAAPEVDDAGNVRLENLTELRDLSPAHLARVRGVTASYFGGPVSPNWIPPSLERLTCGDPNYNEVGEVLEPGWIPPLPPTLTELVMGFFSPTNARHADIGTYLQRAFSTATSLRDVSMPVYDGSQVAALPQSVEVLFIKHFTTSPIPRDAWPKSLKEVIIDCDDEAQVRLGPMELPPGLVSIALPVTWNYTHYNHTIAELANTSGNTLRNIRFGSGYSSFSGDLFAALPRQVEVVTYESLKIEIAQANIESLPDTVKILEWDVKEPVSRWPARLEKLAISGTNFQGSIDTLPDSVRALRLPEYYNIPVTRWPNSLLVLSLGSQFSDMAAMQRLPATIETLNIPITVARRLMESGRIPSALKKLSLIGRPDSTRAFDVRQLPQQCTNLILDGLRGDKPLVVGRGERSDVQVMVAALSKGLRERDMEAAHQLLTEPQYALQDPQENSSSSDPEVESVSANTVSELAFPKPTSPDFDHSDAEVPHGWVDKATLLDRLKAATVNNPVRSLLLKEASDEDVLKEIAAALKEGRIAGTLQLRVVSEQIVRPRAARILLAAIAEAPALTKLSIKQCSQLFEAAARPDAPAPSPALGSVAGFGGFPGLALPSSNRGFPSLFAGGLDLSFFPSGNSLSPFEPAVVTYNDNGIEKSLTIDAGSSIGSSCNGEPFLVEYQLAKSPNPNNSKENAWIQPHPVGPARGPNAFQLNANTSCEDEVLQCELQVPALGATLHATIKRKGKVAAPLEVSSGSSSESFSSSAAADTDLPRHTSSFAAFFSLLSNRSLRTLVMRDFHRIFCSTTDPLPQLVYALQRAPNLRGLDLDGMQFGSLSPHTGDTSAHIAGCGSDGVAPFTAWLRSPECSLQHVVLKSTDLSVADVFELCKAAKENSRLITLDLSHNRVGAAGLYAYHWVLRHHPTLRLVVNSDRDLCLPHNSPWLSAPKRPRRLVEEDDHDQNAAAVGELKDINYD